MSLIQSLETAKFLSNSDPNVVLISTPPLFRFSHLMNRPMKPSQYRESIGTFLFDDEGATSVEYAVMLSLILVALLGGFFALSFATRSSFDTIAEKISDAFAN